MPRWYPDSVCRQGYDCPLRHGRVVAGNEQGLPVHPDRCPQAVRKGVVKKFLRRGKDLVLPREHEHVQLREEFPPEVCHDWIQQYAAVAEFVVQHLRLPDVGLGNVEAVVPSDDEVALGQWWC